MHKWLFADKSLLGKLVTFLLPRQRILPKESNLDAAKAPLCRAQVYVYQRTVRTVDKSSLVIKISDRVIIARTGLFQVLSLLMVGGIGSMGLVAIGGSLGQLSSALTGESLLGTEIEIIC